MAIKAIIFDMDGLLINSEPLWLRAKIELMEKMNNNWTHADQTNTLGVSTQTWVDYVYNKIDGEITKEKVLTEIIDRMKSYYNNGKLELMPGAQNALEYAKKGYKVGLASGSYKELLFSAVKINKWENIFDEILSSDDLKMGKPYPDIYIEVCKRLSVSPSESIVLEDSRDGIRAGVAAGTKVIAVPSKEVPVPNETLESAFLIIDSLDDFPDALRKLY